MVFETIVSAIPPLRLKAKYSILGLSDGLFFEIVEEVWFKREGLTEEEILRRFLR